MIVEILKSCDHIGTKKGHHYEAEPFWQDPQSKVRLKNRINKTTGKRIGVDPMVNEYRHNIKIIKTKEDGE